MNRSLLAISALVLLGIACSNEPAGSNDVPDQSVSPDTQGDILADQAPQDLIPTDLPPDVLEETQPGDLNQEELDGVAGDQLDEVEEPPQDWHLPAIATCAPSADACAAAAVTQAAATYRSDFYYPFEVYPELGNEVVEGGRIQLAAVAEVGGAVTKVEINGTDVTPLAFPKDLSKDAETPQEVLDLTQDGSFHWVHVWPFELTAGAPLMVNFHVGTTALESANSVQVRITTDQGVALEGSVPMAKPAVPLTYVTTSEDFSTLFIHVRNEDTTPHTLQKLEVLGRDVTQAACIPSATLQPKQTAMWEVPLCTPLKQGDLWTVVARFQSGAASVGTGRVILAHYPIHSWVSGDDCPFPGANWQNYIEHRIRGFDTFFLRGNFNGKEGCNDATSQSVIATSAAYDDVYFLLDEWAQPGTEVVSHIARLLGDEVDSDRLDKPWRVSRDTKRSWTEQPGLTTYIGAARHRPNGAFAGIADLQGMDIYFASCAPTILSQTLPGLKAPYDYFRAVIQNQRPGPTWFYSQGLASGWIGNPNAMELKVSVMSVVASAAKGLMYFMTPLEEAEKWPETWDAMGEVNRVVRGIRHYLREGDGIGASSSLPDILVEAIRARDAIVVPVVNVTVKTALDYMRCLFEDDAHWEVADVVTDVSFEVPEDFAVVDILEVRDGEVLTPSQTVAAKGRKLTIQAVEMSDSQPYRVFVVVGKEKVGEEIEEAMKIGEVER